MKEIATKMIIIPLLLFVTSFATAEECPKPKQERCYLPKIMFGTYTSIMRFEGDKFGNALLAVMLNVTCDPEYRLVGPRIVFCVNGAWSSEIPVCQPDCHLTWTPDIKYRCFVNGSDGETRDCEEYEAEGQVVQPECIAPNYQSYNGKPLPKITCLQRGFWENRGYVVCKPVCGRYDPPSGSETSVDQPAQMPWISLIYKKRSISPTYHCLGSLVSPNVVISAAHCYWEFFSEVDPSLYIVAVGKAYSSFNESLDTHAQTSDVKQINIAPWFFGHSLKYSHDLAALIVKDSFTYNNYVKPICVMIYKLFERFTLKPGDIGLITSWADYNETKADNSIKTIEVPYLDNEECHNLAPKSLEDYITDDKICASFGNRKRRVICATDGGSGYYVPTMNKYKNVTTYYLGGVASNIHYGDNRCSGLAFLTDTAAYDNFIIKHFK